jgi:hypothetical protein
MTNTRTLRAVERDILKEALGLINRQGWIEITVRKRDRLETLVAEYRARHAAARKRKGKK